MALTAAETGHLVFGTLHTQDAPQTIDRVIDVFPTNQQEQVRTMLSAALEGVVTQQLILNAEGTGRLAACEVMMCTPGDQEPDKEQQDPPDLFAHADRCDLRDADDGPGTRRSS